jgi:hypothetical protein
MFYRSRKTDLLPEAGDAAIGSDSPVPLAAA